MLKSVLKSSIITIFVICTSVASANHDPRLQKVLDARSDETKARDQYRHPKETLHLLSIQEGMTVVDALPGSWYGDIITPLIGEKGTYIGVNYGEWFYENRFPDDAENRWEKAQAWLSEWPEEASQYGGGKNSPDIAAYFFPGLPESMNETADAWLFIRALHHTNRFDSKYLDMSAADAFRVLKSGGLAGVVQHRAPEDADDVWADGSKGYLKQSRVIQAFKKAGFVLENASEINANRKDQPTESDFVWRLLPSNKDDATAQAIGESDRMTLVFRKP